MILTVIIYTNNALSEIIYSKNNLIITNIDLNNYKQIYKNNYNLDIDNNNALKDLVLINNLIRHFEKFNKEFDSINSLTNKEEFAFLAEKPSVIINKEKTLKLSLIRKDKEFTYILFANHSPIRRKNF